MGYRVRLVDRKTGEERDSEHHPYEWNEFWWKTGNMSCDCNRADAFAQAVGLKGWEPMASCGGVRFAVPFATLDTGEVILVDGNWREPYELDDENVEAVNELASVRP